MTDSPLKIEIEYDDAGGAVILINARIIPPDLDAAIGKSQFEFQGLRLKRKPSRLNDLVNSLAIIPGLTHYAIRRGSKGHSQTEIQLLKRWQADGNAIEKAVLGAVAVALGLMPENLLIVRRPLPLKMHNGAVAMAEEMAKRQAGTASA